jgi:hypothetical protein
MSTEQPVGEIYVGNRTISDPDPGEVATLSELQQQQASADASDRRSRADFGDNLSLASVSIQGVRRAAVFASGRIASSLRPYGRIPNMP